MKVHRRGASSPSLLLEASEPPTSVNANDNYYQFELEPHHVERGKRGQKIFICDLCPAPGGVFKRSFSLKRHYLRFHINFAFLSPRDVNNCAIAVAGQHQRSGFPGSGPNDRLANRLNNPSPLLFRCHHCGRLLKTKKDLLKHLGSHGRSSQTATVESTNGDRQQGETNRCPRCSTAFSLRKTLLRHVKKNQCMGGNQSPPELLIPPSKPEFETGLQSGETSEAGDDCLAISPIEEIEEIDMETSLRPGCPASLFRFACTLCAKMFHSYISMCRHRRLAHGRYGICSPSWLLSRKMSGKLTSLQPSLSPIASFGNNENSQDLSLIVNNANDNLNRFLDGKKSHIRSIAPTDEKFDAEEAEDGDPRPPQRWSWGETNFNVSEVHKLDVPIQMAYRDGLQSWKLQEIAKIDGNTSQAGSEEMDISTALNLCPAKIVQSVKVETALRHPELSGEWILKKRYICSPCGEIFHDFLALLNHQQKGHNGVYCTHIQLDQSIEVGLADELTRQITRSGNGGINDTPDSYQCTKCHFVVQSIPELHSHILLCSNYVSASPYRKRRFTVNQSSRRNHWSQPESKNGRSRGMQRTVSSQTKNSSATRSARTRSPKEDATDKDAPGALRRSTRRVLSFSESPLTKKIKSSVTKRLLRQRINPQQANGSVTPKKPLNEIKKKTTSMDTKSTTKSATALHECDGCQKKFQSHTSVLKHKYYCPNKLTDSTEIPIRISTPVKKPISVTAKTQTKRLTRDSGKDKGHIGSPTTERKSDVLPSFLVNDSKSSILARVNGNQPAVSSTQKKKVSKPSTPVAPAEISSAKPPVKSKMLLQSVSGSTKSHRNAAKNGSVKDEKEPEKTPVALERRPIRSSRKVSMVLLMEDQVEASFLEALSPEQRVRVTEQRCPFCSKHYVYRSNFKRHLLEGCDAIDVDEVAINLSSVSKKKHKSTDTVSPSSNLKTEQKEKNNQSLIDIKFTGNRSQKKLRQIEDVSEAKSKKATIVNKKNVKKPPTFSKSKSVKVQEPKKSTENLAPKEAATEIELARQPSRNAKQIARKDKGTVNPHQRKGKASRTPVNSYERKESMDNFKDKEEKIVKSSFDKPDFPRNGTSKKTAKPNSSFSFTDNKSVERKNKGSNPDEKEQSISIAIECPPGHCSNGTGEGNDKIKTFSAETESAKILVNGERLKSEATALSYKEFRTTGHCRSSNVLTTDCTTRPKLFSSKTIISNCIESHALDRLQLGQVLEEAIRRGIFKSYTKLTKYPIRMRHLENMVRAYLQAMR